MARMPKRGPRRSENVLTRLWNRTAAKAVSRVDRPGWIYVFRERDLWKVGRTNNRSRRVREWRRVCPVRERQWVPQSVWTPFANRTEFLIHLAIERVCVSRPRFRCHECGKVHREKFYLGDDLGNAELILLIIQNVVDFVLTN
ncbi:hypothetical protein D9757_014546 [Collybiopsis confluens]|uniref:Bacteriophage T5 Orf172 DNA-binding domain-containing protein n=1 Tax=Collybiopsis confluens TaxID=2823264 RepID=A0A8H5D1Z8_9AGAR|nr:hypothetical protein D9757_014546 [Collybiopsis confluens]